MEQVTTRAIYNPETSQRGEGGTLVVIQPTNYCNLDCTYCYLPGRSDRGRIADDTVGEIAERLAESPLVSGRVTVLWHAGEPLTVAPAAYRRWCRTLRGTLEGTGREVDFAVQTNGTLVSPLWCELFTDEGWSVCLSVDGPAAVHDALRVDRAGHPTHTKVLTAARLLRDHGIRRNALAVLTRRSLVNPTGMYNFFKDLEIGEVGFNVAEISGVNRRAGLDKGELADLTDFYRTFVRLLEADGHPFTVRELRQVSQALLSPHFPEHSTTNQTNVTGAIWTFDRLGRYWTFCPDLAYEPSAGEVAIGQVSSTSLADAVRSEPYLRLRDEIDEGLSRCRSECSYWAFCGGGSPSNKFAELGTAAGTLTLHCQLAVHAVVDAVLAELTSSHERSHP